MKLSDDEVGLFLGGLLSVQVLTRARELGGDLTDDQWEAQKAQLAATAFDDVVDVFPEPLRTKLRADRANYIASVMNLN